MDELVNKDLKWIWLPNLCFPSNHWVEFFQTIERPKMKLRKSKVKVKKTSKPKSTTRIVTKVTNLGLLPPTAGKDT